LFTKLSAEKILDVPDEAFVSERTPCSRMASDLAPVCCRDTQKRLPVVGLTEALGSDLSTCILAQFVIDHRPSWRFD